MDYFLIRNLGYDGLIVEKLPSSEEAKSRFDEMLKEAKKWDERYPNYPSDKSLIVIEGSVTYQDSPECITG